MKCPKCGGETPNGSNFCQHCRAPLNANYKSNEELESQIRQDKIDLQKEIEKTKTAETGKTIAERERDVAKNNLRDTQIQHNKEKEKNKNKNNLIIIISLAVLLLLGGGFAYQYFSVDDTGIESVSAPSEVLSKLPGNYTLREYNNGELVGNSKTAVLRKENSDYVITIVTDYGPERHIIKNGSDNTLHSETLGEGKVTYKEEINKITIKFNKDNYSWEFVR